MALRFQYTFSLIYIQASLLVVPQVCVECEVRVYDKRKAENHASDDQETLK